MDLIVPSNSFNGTINKDIDLALSNVIRVEPDAFLGTGICFVKKVYFKNNLFL